MNNPNSFEIEAWQAVPLEESVQRLVANTPRDKRPLDTLWEVTAGVRPVDVYVYLKARFGEPNGVTMIGKKDDSDNLIHWHYTVACSAGNIDIMCFSFRLEVWQPFGDKTMLPLFLEVLKNDFKKYGPAMSVVRGKLERWQMFLNPYVRLKEMLESMLEELEGLDLPGTEHPSLHHGEATEEIRERFDAAAQKFSRGAQICLSVRMLAPVCAEAFVNLILFLLARPDIKKDTRLYDSIVRQNIDVRIRGLHVNCVGFVHAVNYDEWEACKRFHTMMMGRNDMLHGNMDPRLTSFHEVYFERKTPLFVEFKDFAFFSYQAGFIGATPAQAIDDYQVIQDLAAHILVCLDESISDEIRAMALRRDLGWDAARQVPGILFPETMVDFRMLPATIATPESAAQPAVATDE